MRINNNIMAMNTHRQYGINNNNVAKSIAKLSSGYRINSAADDAAGLAISEKMRAQIRGLQMASKNSQDGISLVQTAEGALQTSHDILQKMRELAVQSASDTNETTIDRAALNREFQQLIAEIDDTASKTRFNDMNLIDGTFQKAFNEISSTTGLSEDSKAMFAKSTAVGTYTTAFELVSTKEEGAVDAVKPNKFDPSSLFGLDKATLSFDYKTREEALYEALKDYATENSITLAYADKTLEEAIDDGEYTNYAGALADVSAVADDATDVEIRAAANTVSGGLNNIPWGTSTKVEVTALTKGVADDDNMWKVSLKAGDATDAVEEDVFIDTAALKLNADGKLDEKTTLDLAIGDGGKLSITLEKGASLDDLETTINSILTAATPLDVDAYGKATTIKESIITFEGGQEWTTGANVPASDIWNGEWEMAVTGAAAGDALDSVNFTFTHANGTTANATVDKSKLIALNTNEIANAGKHLFELDFGELGKMTIGVNVAATSGSESDTTAADAIVTGIKSALEAFGAGATGDDGVGLFVDGGVTAVAGTPTALDAKDRYVELSFTKDGTVINKPNDDPKAAAEALKVQLKVGDTGYEIEGTGVRVEFARALTAEDFEDAAALAKIINGDDATALANHEITVGTGSGKDFVIQTGANQGDELAINIDRMDAWNLGIERSNVSTREAASKAITQVNDAINHVSTQRSELGALQNRLEFKIQNLDISAENLSAAESRIRDLDMAKEMTTFTRNNILSQAATAMLAQANALPQGVLQLLG